MRPPIPRFVRWTVVFAVIAALTVAVFQYWETAQTGSETAQAGVTQTAWGPLGPADRDLLVKVRQAGLWEQPTGQQAQQQGSSARVREVGGLISAEHADLDAQVRDVAARLGVLLPNQPTEQQQEWMAEIASQSGADFDRTFVQRLRVAHGNVLPIIADVRSGTRNELVRQFATTAAQFVTRHHEYLESTGLVDFSALPEPPAPAAAPPAPAVPAAAAPPAGDAPPAGHGAEHVNQVVQATPASGANVMVAAVVYIAALLAIVGLLGLLGTAGVRARRSQGRSQHDPQGRSPHAHDPRSRPHSPPSDPPGRSRSRSSGGPQTAPQPAMTASGGPPSRPRHAAQRW